MADIDNLGLNFRNAENISSALLKDNKVVTLHIEVCQNSLKHLRSSDVSVIQDLLEKYFMEKDEFTLNVLISDTVPPFDVVKYIRICSADDKHKISFLRDTVIKHYHIYKPWTFGPQIYYFSVGNKEYPGSHKWSLPNTALEGLWESLILDNGLKEELLSYVQTNLLYSRKKVNPKYVLRNNVVLLHGPPGTGKTSLCKAVAQKLSIRLNSQYKDIELIEVNSQNLFSKWYSESAKIVYEFFESIKSNLHIQDHFYCILIDEVESLTQTRISGKCEPSDSVKVINTVLTQLDELQHYSNFLILGTSNITEIIDTAFADRADLKLYIPYPSKMDIYEIYRSSLEELIFCDLIIGNKNDFFEGVIFKHMLCGTQDENNGIVNEIMQNSKTLLNICNLSESLSGRALRKIPFLTSAKFANDEIPNVREYLEVMKQVVTDFKLRNNEFCKI